MTLIRPLLNLLLALALLASGPLPVLAADHAPPAPASAPCHDPDGPAPSPDLVDADCCGGEPGYCGCDCLQHAAAAPLRLQRFPQPPPAAPEVAMASPAFPQSRATPDTRPPIA